VCAGGGFAAGVLPIDTKNTIHADAPRAFHADDRPGCRKEAGEDGWRRCLARRGDHGAA
jgi:hypothetical protein